VNSITGGTDAQGGVTVRLLQGDRVVNGQAADTDIVIASAKAYVNALNKLSQQGFREHPQIAAADV
jgi:2-isopropylmalate synthase